MKQNMRWHDYITINIYCLGMNISAGIITPVLLPYLVAQFMPQAYKNTYVATIRVVGLAVAMLVQPIAGMLSDRSTLRWGRRRPFILTGAAFNLLFLLVVGASYTLMNSPLDAFLWPSLGLTTAYAALLVGIVLLQVSSNVAQGAQQGLIPDLVPEHQRGRVSGVKAMLEMLPLFAAPLIGPVIDAGEVWLAVGIIMAGFCITGSITILFVHEEPLREKPAGTIGRPSLRLVALTAIFVAVSQAAVWLVRSSGDWLAAQGADVGLQVAIVGLTGLIGMAGSIFVGVYFGAWVGIGAEARRQTGFIWWVVNRLLFLAAVGSIQGSAQYFLSDVLRIPDTDVATKTTVLLAVVGLCLLPSALGGGYLADRIGRKRLVAISALVAAAGTVALLFATSFPWVLAGGCVIGLGTGAFLATNWALGTDLAPRGDAGRYLGISNLAGAGAGIVGAGIGGPIADFFNGLQQGLGYLVILAIYAALFLLSIAALARVKKPDG